MKKLNKLASAYRIDRGNRFRLKQVDPDDTYGIASREHAAPALEQGLRHLTDLQDKLYAQERWAVLLILQGMDAAGKDSVIKHGMSGVNPQGCSVYSFNVPSGEDLNHDYLWRHIRKLPERRRVGIFNRSYYEEVLAVRVHSELLRTEKIPSSLLGTKIWKRRFEEICCFERYLAHNGIVTRKFFLHISKEEQAKRLLERLEEPEKNWKFSISDVHERQHWDDYMDAYEDAIRNTCAPFAPWYVVPADHKWFARLVVASTVIAALEELHLGYPKIDTERRKELEAARSLLLSEQATLK